MASIIKLVASEEQHGVIMKKGGNNTRISENMSKETLYIIGNGFDLYHGLETEYSNFLNYVKVKDSELFGYLEQYFTGDLWYDFENALATLDTSEVLSDAGNLFSPNEESDKWSDIYIIEDYADNIREVLTKHLKDNLIDWILKLKYPEKKDVNLLNLDRNAEFLTFNYTEVLEHFYDIEANKITYLHNKVPKYHFNHGEREYFSDEIIIGHAVNKKLQAPKPYKKGMKIAIAYQEAFDKLEQYFIESFKDTKKIILNNQTFFENLSNIENIIIFGHSLSDIDMPYFQAISKRAINVKEWKITYHRENELSKIKTQALKFLHRLNNVCFLNSEK